MSRKTFVVIIRRRGRCTDVHRAVQCGFSTRISRKRNADYVINLLNPIRFREERLSRKVDGFDSCFDILHPADVLLTFENSRRADFFSGRCVGEIMGRFFNEYHDRRRTPYDVRSTRNEVELYMCVYREEFSSRAGCELSNGGCNNLNKFVLLLVETNNGKGSISCNIFIIANVILHY